MWQVGCPRRSASSSLQTLAFSILTDEPMPGVNAEYRLMMLSELARASRQRTQPHRSPNQCAGFMAMNLLQLHQIDRLTFCRQMLSELARASGVAGMCGGQALDLAAEGQSVDLVQSRRPASVMHRQPVSRYLRHI
jgi:farnesyl diphosphate synthase